jgi:hypothetical protein
MPNHQQLPAQTASRKESIWRDVNHNDFRSNVVALQNASNEVPRDPKVYTKDEWLARGIRAVDIGHVLPFNVEQQLADDLAFIAAAEEGVKAVSAVGLEELVEHRGLIVRLAANDVMPRHIPETFEKMFGILKHCARRGSYSLFSASPFSLLSLSLVLARELCTEQLFTHVMLLSRKRIHGRLQSAHWDTPDYRRGNIEPLHQELRKVSRQLKQLQPNSYPDSTTLNQRLDNLCNAYQHIDSCRKDTEEESQCLKDVVRQSYALCTSDGRCVIEETISAYGFEPKGVCANKHIRQANKIGRYWGLCVYMAEVSRKYRDIFMNVSLQALRPYMDIKSPISFKGREVSCHVHAEIQLLTFYGQNPNPATLTPRVLGVSKSACYLCDLFILNHGQFFITKTHGRLHDQWNVPDLAEFGQSQRDDYRRILVAMNRELETAIVNERNSPQRLNRKFPVGSWLSLPTAFPLSPVASSAGTAVSENSKQTSVAPRIALVDSTPRPISTSSHNQTEVQHIPEVTISNTSKEPLSLCSESIASSEFPVQRTITASSPFHIATGKLSLGFELEGPGQRKVTIDHAMDDETIGNAIDVGTMVPGDPLHIERSNNEDRLVFALCYGRNTSLQVILHSRRSMSSLS